ncbi:hypothetical protein DFH07DRAFT_781062 [Mycena maculata]|uniref:Uncharacterized protein n=1 Tax=Mycena maculata TaxID=230809 RepID=A0AAD7I001_9AGAR|nr:hypothetical protein DFH07DRAFT_781062 [Mycena maculata]
MEKNPFLEAAWLAATESVLVTETVLVMYGRVACAHSVGIYIVLATLAFWFLHHRRPAGHRTLACLLAAMLTLCTVEMVLQAITTTLLLQTLYSAEEDSTQSIQQASFQRLDTTISLAEQVLVITNNAMADILLIYRCYIIWRNTGHERVIALPVLLAIATMVLGYLDAYQTYVASTRNLDLPIFFALALATNLTLTGLTVGRILYTKWSVKIVGQTNLIRRYNTAIKMLLESAVLYLIFNVTMLVARSLSEFKVANILYGVSAILVSQDETMYYIVQRNTEITWKPSTRLMCEEEAWIIGGGTG